MKTYTQLTRELRYQIKVLLKMGHTHTEMARALGVNKLQKPEHGAQANRSKPHTLTGTWRTPKPGEIYLRSENWQYKGVLNYRAASFEKDWKELIDYLRALNQLGWQPDDEQIIAYYWIIEKQWELCEKAGLPAVEALIIALRNVALDEQVVIAGILGEIGDRRAVFPLINRLRAFGDHRRSLMMMENVLHERVKGFDSLAAYMDDDSPGHSTYHFDLAKSVEEEKELDITQKEIERVNNQILFIETTLGKITGEAIGSDPDLWEVWWLEQTDIVK